MIAANVRAHFDEACYSLGLDPNTVFLRRRNRTLGDIDDRERVWVWMRLNPLAGLDHPPSYPDISEATGGTRTGHATVIGAVRRRLGERLYREAPSVIGLRAHPDRPRRQARPAPRVSGNDAGRFLAALRREDGWRQAEAESPGLITFAVCPA